MLIYSDYVFVPTVVKIYKSKKLFGFCSYSYVYDILAVVATHFLLNITLKLGIATNMDRDWFSQGRTASTLDYSLGV